MKNIKPFDNFFSSPIFEGRRPSTPQISHGDLLAESDAEQFELMEAMFAEALFEEDVPAAAPAAAPSPGKAEGAAPAKTDPAKTGTSKKGPSKKEASKNIDQRIKETDSKAKQAAASMGIQPSTEFNKLIELHKKGMAKLKSLNSGQQLDPEAKMQKIGEIAEFKEIGKSINVVLGNMAKRAAQYPFYYQTPAFKETLKKLVAISMAVQSAPGQSPNPQVPTKKGGGGFMGFISHMFSDGAEAAKKLAGVKK
jgi:hypothetical protein